MNSLHLKLNPSPETTNPSKPQDPFPSIPPINPSNKEISFQDPSQSDFPKASAEISNLKTFQPSANVFPALINEVSPKKMYSFSNYLISPIKDLRYKESAFTPLKNETNYFYFSPSKIFEMKTESPFERMEQSSAKNKFQYPSSNNNNNNIQNVIQGKKINFNDNNIQIIKNGNNNLNEKFNSFDMPVITNQQINNKYICTCTKTNCKKKYCACYANGRYCDGCQCENCENKCPINMNSNIKGDYNIEGGINNEIGNNANTICNCTKSNCRKKYCECYKVGKKCSWLCRCVGCLNCLSAIAKCGEFEIEGFGIEIKDNVICIVKRIVDWSEKGEEKKGNEEDRIEYENKEMITPMKVGNKKRNRGETITKTIGQISTNHKSAVSKAICDQGKSNKRVTRKKLKI